MIAIYCQESYYLALASSSSKDLHLFREMMKEHYCRDGEVPQTTEIILVFSGCKISSKILEENFTKKIIGVDLFEDEVKEYYTYLDALIFSKKENVFYGMCFLSPSNVRYILYEREVASLFFFLEVISLSPPPKNKGIIQRCRKIQEVYPNNKVSSDLISSEICGYLSSEFTECTSRYIVSGEMEKGVRNLCNFVNSRKKKELRPYIEYYPQKNFIAQKVNGWDRVCSEISESGGNIIVDLFLEKTFIFEKETLFDIGKIPYRGWWIGFAHHTLDEKYSFSESGKRVVENTFFKSSLEMCRGIIVLSEKLKEDYLSLNLGVDVYSISHPTKQLPPSLHFNYKDWVEGGKRIMSVGEWYRNHFYFCKSKFSFEHKKVWLRKSNSPFTIDSMMIKFPHLEKNSYLRWCYIHLKEKHFPIPEGEFVFDLFSTDVVGEVIHLQKEIHSHLLSVEIEEFALESEYNNKLKRSVVFLKLEDAAAVNVVVECISSSTPIIVNKLPSIVEYLGEEYPLFYENEEDITLFTESDVLRGWKYLHSIDKWKFSIDSFSFEFDKILKSIYAKMKDDNLI